MAPVCEGAGSYFAQAQSLVIFVMWHSALVTLCSKFEQNSCISVVSLPLEALHRSAFSNMAAKDIWSCDTPLWWRIETKRYALYLINQKHESSHINNNILQI